MKILVTGAKGFIGQNLIAGLKNHNISDIYEYDQDTDIILLEQFCKEAELVYHLAGTNRPKDNKEFMNNNAGFTEQILNMLKKYKNICPIVYSSTIQANQDNPYGRSKKAGEELLFKYAKETGARVIIYRISNVFGKWCRPNYNSVIATLSFNMINNLPITISDPKHNMQLVYIDDLIKEMISVCDNDNQKSGLGDIPITYMSSLGKIEELLRQFKDSREKRTIPDMSDEFTSKLYSTFLSYLPENKQNYQLMRNVDTRGSFTEFIKGETFGQVSVNISKPGIIKGNHWHNLKHEKFLVVSGTGVIRLRKITSKDIIQYKVGGDVLEVIDIPVGYAHNIENQGTTDMISIIWASDVFDPNNQDTYYMEV